MYKRILVPLDNSPTDGPIVAHVLDLARHCGASILLIHVADGFAARISATGLQVDALLAGGDPTEEIVAAAIREKCDLIAMGTHGHRFLKDVFFGSVANEVRHQSLVPVLLVRGNPDDRPAK